MTIQTTLILKQLYQTVTYDTLKSKQIFVSKRILFRYYKLFNYLQLKLQQS